MNAVNQIATSIFDVVMPAFEWMGVQLALIVVSGIFGVLALVVFKQISWQGGIKDTKDKIKGHMIAIRIYQDDLVVVAVSVIKVLLRNFQYLAYNFGPILPLLAPFVLVLAQLVVRYGYAPIPVQEAGEHPMPGKGTLVQVQMAPGHEGEVRGLEVILPAGVETVNGLVRAPSVGRAFIEVYAVEAGEHTLRFRLPGGREETKLLVAGLKPGHLMQPQRVSGFWLAWLYPAEETFPSDSPIAGVSFDYPDRDLGWLPGGEGGVLIVFFIASMLFGAAALKPLKVQI
jgi:hypothetical protein